MGEHLMRRLAKPMLFAAAFIWGSSFFIMKDALDALPVQYLLAIRFTAGAVLLGLLCWDAAPVLAIGCIGFAVVSTVGSGAITIVFTQKGGVHCEPAY